MEKMNENEETKENEKRCQAIYQATGTDMIGYPGTKQPHQQIGNEVASEKDNTCYAVIKKEQGRS